MTTTAAQEANTGKFRAQHGHANDGLGKRSPTYNSWRCALDRCRRDKHPYYPRYGGRGITVCDRWTNGEGGLSAFQCFLADMGLRPSLYHTLEREDGDGNYCKSNCSWATKKEQANNRRTNHLVNWKGEERTLSEVVDLAGVRRNYPTILGRLGRGWSLEEAVNTPVQAHERPEYKKRKRSKT